MKKSSLRGKSICRCDGLQRGGLPLKSKKRRPCPLGGYLDETGLVEVVPLANPNNPASRYFGQLFTDKPICFLNHASDNGAAPPRSKRPDTISLQVPASTVRTRATRTFWVLRPIDRPSASFDSSKRMPFPSAWLTSVGIDLKVRQ